MRRKKKSLLALLLAAVMVILSGCGGMTKEDAKDYVQAVLDVSYKGDVKGYLEQTDTTEKEAKELYESNIDETLNLAGFNDMNLSEEMLANYRQLFIDMLKSADYKLADAKDGEDDGFTVDVTVKPFMGFEGVSEEVLESVQEKVFSGTEVPSEDDVNEMLFQAMYDMLSERMKEPVYGDEKVITVHVAKDKDGVFYIPDEDIDTIDEALFPNNI